MSLHFFVGFEPLPGKEEEFRAEVLRTVEATRAESGCLAIRLFESIREPLVFAIHSEWVDEAAFELHANLPLTVRFLGVADRLLTHGVQGVRTREIAGGPGTGRVRRLVDNGPQPQAATPDVSRRDCGGCFSFQLL